MKIVHICLASNYTEGLTYQDNLLSEQNVKDGHSVTVISNCSCFINGKLEKTIAVDCILTNGIRLIRLPYKHMVSDFISEKIRKVKGLYDILQTIEPDIIYHHGVNDWELFTVSKYKKNNKKIKLYCDSHADYYTTGTNWVSLKILHSIFYKFIIKKCINRIDKIFYISENCKLFLEEVYKIKGDKYIEFLPLGGIISKGEKRKADWCKIRKELQIDERSILLLHAGKLDANKKTVELLSSFSKVKRDDMHMVIVGTIEDEIIEKVMNIIENSKYVHYVGWKTGGELITYLNACDMYLQPGKVSAIAQNAICAECAVVLNNLMDYKLFVKGNGYLINCTEELVNILNNITLTQIIEMKKNSKEIANKYLNYAKLAERLYQ